MDHALQTVSYIADIDDILVVMARQGLVSPSGGEGASEHDSLAQGRRRLVNICCHIFESDEVGSV